MPAVSGSGVKPMACTWCPHCCRRKTGACRVDRRRSTSPRRGEPRFVDPRSQARADALRDDERHVEQIAADTILALLQIAPKPIRTRCSSATGPPCACSSPNVTSPTPSRPRPSRTQAGRAPAGNTNNPSKSSSTGSHRPESTRAGWLSTGSAQPNPPPQSRPSRSQPAPILQRPVLSARADRGSPRPYSPVIELVEITQPDLETGSPGLEQARPPSANDPRR